MVSWSVRAGWEMPVARLGVQPSVRMVSSFFSGKCGLSVGAREGLVASQRSRCSESFK